MLKRIVISVLIAIAVGIVVYLIGVLLSTATPLVALGSILEGFAWLLGLIAGIWFFVTNENVLR